MINNHGKYKKVREKEKLYNKIKQNRYINMERVREFFRKLSKGDLKSMGTSALIFLAMFALLFFIGLPMLLVAGLMLIGFDVELSLKSWLGSVLIVVYLMLINGSK